MSDSPASRTSLMTWIHAFKDAVSGQRILYLIFTAGCVGLIYAKALLSIFSGVLFGVAVLQFLFDRRSLSDLNKYPALIAIMCIVLIYVISGLHSDNTARWAKLAWQSIPFATIPLGFYTYRKMPSETWRRLMIIFIAVCTLSALSVMIDYVLHFDAYNALYKIGKTIPTPIIHVRYSYFLAMAACLAFALAYVERKTESNRKHLLLFAGIFLAVVIHVLAVRTGLISLYGGILVMMACMVFRDGKWKLGITSAVSVFLLVLIAYNAFPSIANKIGYMMYDLGKLSEQGALAEYSDNVRITSISHGLDLLKENLITGTGIGDLKAEMQRMYQEKTPNFPPESQFPPISQFIFTLAAFGIAGTAVFYFLLLYPLFRTPFSYVLIALYSTMLFASLGESTIELHQGKTVFVTLLCIGMFYASTKDPHADQGTLKSPSE